jgi:hypothetical protein
MDLWLASRSRIGAERGTLAPALVDSFCATGSVMCWKVGIDKLGCRAAVECNSNRVALLEDKLHPVHHSATLQAKTEENHHQPATRRPRQDGRRDLNEHPGR